ncbi:MAG: bifunctional 4-hydroxy-3-methylbut-2-enyl diphosphate reductase/30S ribosomal protein S1 [Oscillospiraceae bacterium]|nr:bifunctional 4-hydroxy-3-methylbut-2-enyl diphosphate reductase/30S ribosomal protein S1 [Oscillospiraceae bacterium]
MAKIVVAKSAGFCFGVDRAVKIVYDELKKHKTATLGPIIHNKSVVEDLKSKGGRVVNSIDELKTEECVIIRSHGIGADVYKKLEERGISYVDATCPFVAKIHSIVKEKCAQGFEILIAGDKNHPEVEGIVGHCQQSAHVFKDDEELKNFFAENPEIFQKKVAIVAQTTYNIKIWDKCIQIAKEFCGSPQIYDTICNATSNRQKEAEELAKASDVMVIIGGKDSSNTIKLYDVCSQYCKCYHIEDAGELCGTYFSGTVSIGITAGASTPAYIIKEVQKQMSEMLKNQEEDFNFEEALEQSFKKIYIGNRVKGYITAVNANEAIVDIGTKHTGYVPLSELTDDPGLKPSDVVKVGDEVDLIVTKINDQDGIVTLSKKKVDAMVGFENILKAKDSGAVLEGVVVGAVKGGLLISSGGVRVFVPASQATTRREEKLEDYLKKTVQFKVIEVNEQRSRAVGSIKAVAKEQREEEEKKFWGTVKTGDVFKGEVKSLTSYGAFVNLGPVDGMVHISELSWNKIKHPSEVVKVGDILEVYVKDLDAEKKRISLGFKKNEENPWEIFKNEYKVGDVVTAKVVSITPFGAFAQIIPGIDGLIHISQISTQRVNNVKEALSVGQTVEAKITEIDLDRKRISISIRALLEDKQAEQEAKDIADAAKNAGVTVE